MIFTHNLIGESECSYLKTHYIWLSFAKHSERQFHENPMKCILTQVCSHFNSWFCGIHAGSGTWVAINTSRDNFLKKLFVINIFSLYVYHYFCNINTILVTVSDHTRDCRHDREFSISNWKISCHWYLESFSNGSTINYWSKLLVIELPQRGRKISWAGRSDMFNPQL